MAVLAPNNPADLLVNNVITQFAGGGSGPGGALLPGDLSLNVLAGSGGALPSPTNGASTRMVIGLPNGQYEIVKVTARTSDTLTIVREQEGTISPASWPVGTLISCMFTAAMLANLWAPVQYLDVNVMQTGGVFDGVTDDTTAWLAAISRANGGPVHAPAGTSGISGILALSIAGSSIIGAGRWDANTGGGTRLKALGTFSGAEMINITANKCGVMNLTLAGSSTSSSAASVAANAIEINAARDVHVRDVEFQYINGYTVEATGSSPNAPFGAMLDSLHWVHCANGIHLLGASSQSFGMQSFLSNINGEITDSGDVVLLEDCNDILIQNCNGAAGQGSNANSWLHIKGACSSISVSNPDFGVYPGPANAPVMLVESGTNGSPVNVDVLGGFMQAGTNALKIASGANLSFMGVTFMKSNNDGVVITNLTGRCTFSRCTWKTNNQSGGATTYDVNCSSSANFFINFENKCLFETPTGSGAGTVAATINDVNHKCIFENDEFAGASGPSAVFAAGGTPQIVRHCIGYNPRGLVSTPTIGASPATISTSQHDVLIIFSALNNLTAWSINGTTVSQLPNVGGSFYIAARTNIILTYGATAPTMQWYAQ